MIGSRQLGRLLAHARAAGAKVVLVGDAEQLQPIEAGAAFRAIAQRFGVAGMGTVRRQQDEWAREASMDFAQGRVRDGLGAYRARGQVRLLASREEAKAAIARDWVAGQRPGETALILAHTRADVRDLNEAVRTLRREAGGLGQAASIRTEEGVREFAAGDRIVFLKNGRELGVKNGTLGLVEAAAEGRLAVILDNSERRIVDVQAYAALDHGYAVTIHKAQGATVDRALVLASGGMDRHLAYVGMTRHRQQATLYAGRDDFETYEVMAARLSRRHPKETTLDFAERRGIDTLRDWIENGRALLQKAQTRFGQVLAQLGLGGTSGRRMLQVYSSPIAGDTQNILTAPTLPEMAWQAAVAAEFQKVRAKAQRILGKIEKRKAALAQELEKAGRAEPAAPRGLVALWPSARERYEERRAGWMRQRAALLDALHRAGERRNTLREFAGEAIANHASRGEKLAQQKAERRDPALAGAVRAARDKQRSEQVAAMRGGLETEHERGGRGQRRGR
jgi:hypothetical protein